MRKLCIHNLQCLNSWVRYRVVINKGSTLAQVIKEKYANGRFFELAEFIRLLEEAGNGYVDDKVKKYIY